MSVQRLEEISEGSSGLKYDPSITPPFLDNNPATHEAIRSFFLMILAEIEARDEEIAELTVRLAVLEAEVEATSSETAEEVAISFQRQQTIEQLRAELDGVIRQRESLLVEIEESARGSAESQGELEAIIVERDEALRLAAELTEERDSLIHAVDMSALLTSQLETLRAEHTATIAEIKRATQDLEGSGFLADENVELETRVASLQSRLTDTLKAESCLQAEYEELQALLGRKNKRISELEAKSASAVREVDDGTRAELEGIKAIYEAKIADLHRQLQEKAQEPSVIRDGPITVKINGKVETITDVQECIEMLRSKIREQSINSGLRTKELNSTAKSLEEVKAERDQLKTTLDALAKESEEGEAELGSPKKPNERLKNLPSRGQILMEIAFNTQLKASRKDLAAVVTVVAEATLLEHNTVARIVLDMIKDKTIIIDREAQTQRVRLVLSNETKKTLGVEG